ncbi:MAG: MFS transporter [Methanomassiliicoccales archaeon]
MKDRNLHAIFAITMVSVMGVSSITPAFPKMVEHFAISDTEVGLLITAFTVPGVLMTPPLGVLADRFGRKRILVPSLILFGVAGTSCAFAPNFETLLLARFFQGFGAASLGSLNTTIIGDLYEGKRRATAMGYNASVLEVAVGVYPTIGGAMALFGWNYPFFLPLLAFPGALFVIFRLKNPEPENHERLRDYFASTWNVIMQKEAIVLFMASMVSLLVIFGSYLNYFPLLLDKEFAADSPVIGAIMGAMSLTTAVMATQLGNLMARYKPLTLLKASYLLYMLALVLIPLVPSLPLFLVTALIFGIGNGMNIPLIFTLLAERAPMESRGAFMSINGLVLRLGQTVGPLSMGLLFTLGGFSLVFNSGAALFLIMLVPLILVLGRGKRD